MRKTYTLFLAAMLLALVATDSDARGRKPRGGGSGGGTPTNYGCSTLAAGTVVRSPDGASEKRLLMATPACYICNMSTMVCSLQSPTALYGWTFIY